MKPFLSSEVSLSRTTKPATRFLCEADFSKKGKATMRKLAILGSVALLLTSTPGLKTRRHANICCTSSQARSSSSCATVQEELRLSEEQKQKMLDALPEYIQETAAFVEKLDDQKPGEREKAMQSHRHKSGERFTVSLKEILTADQLKRLHQLQLQHEGPGALGRPEIRKDLKITQEQLMQFVGVIKDMQKKIEPLIKEAQTGGNPEEIRPKVIKIRKDHEAKIETLMTEAQREQWKAMRGKPVDVLTD